MPAGQGTSRCWICDNAVWLIPIWTWIVACLTSVFMLAMLRPDAIGGWLLVMGSLLAVIGFCVAMLISERTRDRTLAALPVEAHPAPKLPAAETHRRRS